MSTIVNPHESISGTTAQPPPIDKDGQSCQVTSDSKTVHPRNRNELIFSQPDLNLPNAPFKSQSRKKSQVSLENPNPPGNRRSSRRRSTVQRFNPAEQAWGAQRQEQRRLLAEAAASAARHKLLLGTIYTPPKISGNSGNNNTPIIQKPPPHDHFPKDPLEHSASAPNTESMPGHP